MPQFRYIARRFRDGRRVTGVRNARDLRELAVWLEANGLVLLSGKVVSRERPLPAPDLRRLALVCRELAHLLVAGLPLLSVLDTLSRYAADRKTGPFLSAVARDIEAGKTFSEAWTSHCRVMHEIAGAVIEAGERSGELPTMLEALADYFEEAAALRSRIVSALWYPSVLAITAAGALALFITVILPRFEELLLGLNVKLPALTRFVLGVSRFASHQWVWLVTACAAFAGALAAARRAPILRRHFDAVLLHLPVIGPLLTSAAVYRFAGTASVLLESGLPATQAFEMTARTLANHYLRENLQAAAKRMSEGNTVAESLVHYSVLPELAVEMVAAGERSGRLPEMLRHLARFAHDAVMRDTARLSAVIEPLIILPSAILVGTLALAMLLPYFRLVQNIR